jgi:hypothetical protein
MFYPRLVKNFLGKFIGKGMAKIYLNMCDVFYRKFNNSKGEKVFSESLTTFSYFHRCTKVTDPVEFTRAMLYRGCARITPRGHQGADFILPLVSGDNRLGNILVQVKFTNNYYLNANYIKLNDEQKNSNDESPFGETGKIGEF